MILYQKKPVSTPRDVAADPPEARNFYWYLRRAAIAGHIVDRNRSIFVKDCTHCPDRRLDAVFSSPNALHICQRRNESDGAMTTHPQIANVIEKDHTGNAGSVHWFTQ